MRHSVLPIATVGILAGTMGACSAGDGAPDRQIVIDGVTSQATTGSGEATTSIAGEAPAPYPTLSTNAPNAFSGNYLLLNSVGADVVEVKKALNAMDCSEKTPGVGADLPIEGPTAQTYDEKTVLVVSYFQETHPPRKKDGETGPKTQEHILASYNAKEVNCTPGQTADTTTPTTATATSTAPDNQAKPYTPTQPELITRRDTKSNKVAITINDGPSENTDEILDSLSASGIKVTFCVTGEQIAKHPDIVKRMADEGHELCNQSNSNQDMTKLLAKDRNAATQALIESSEAMKVISGKWPAFFRPPFGAYLDSAGKDVLSPLAAELGMKTLVAGQDGRDWENKDAAAACKLLLEGGPKSNPANTPAAAGSILRLQDTANVPIIDELDCVIKGLKANNLQATTMVDLYNS